MLDGLGRPTSLSTGVQGVVLRAASSGRTGRYRRSI